MRHGWNNSRSYGLLISKHCSVKKILARRQLITVLLFTLFVSAGFFLAWVLYVYIFKNQTGSLLASLPPTMKQAAHDFYTKGIIATIVLVFCAVQLTKLSVRGGKKKWLLFFVVLHLGCL